MNLALLLKQPLLKKTLLKQLAYYANGWYVFGKQQPTEGVEKSSVDEQYSFEAIDSNTAKIVIVAKIHYHQSWQSYTSVSKKELQKISDLHQQYPEYQLTLINTDSIDEQERVKKLIQQYNLAGLDNWGFANTDEEKLRYDIDPRWFGDLPRSYFFPLEGKVKRLRGALTSAELLALFQPS